MLTALRFGHTARHQRILFYYGLTIDPNWDDYAKADQIFWPYIQRVDGVGDFDFQWRTCRDFHFARRSWWQRELFGLRQLDGICCGSHCRWGLSLNGRDDE